MLDFGIPFLLYFISYLYDVFFDLSWRLYDCACYFMLEAFCLCMLLDAKGFMLVHAS